MEAANKSSRYLVGEGNALALLSLARRNTQLRHVITSHPTRSILIGIVFNAGYALMGSKVEHEKRRDHLSS